MSEGTSHHARTRLDEARERLLGLVTPHQRRELVPVGQADGRTAADSLTAERPVPHYERAAMDGYAVRAADVDDSSELLVDDTIGAGRAVPVHTGSPVPTGADAVVRVERTSETAEGVMIETAVSSGQNVAPIGEDVAAGDELVSRGECLSPSALALLAAAGHERIPVMERPRVGLLPTGGELVSATATPGRGETPETNGLAVDRLVHRWGGTAMRHGPVDDTPTAIAAAIDEVLDTDLLVTLAGTSVGDRDHVPSVVQDRGTLTVHGIAVKPGHPAGFGTIGDTPVLMLPGYPVSVLVIASALLRPAVAAAGGGNLPPIPTTEATLDAPIDSESGVRRFTPVRLKRDRAVPVQSAGAGVLSSVTRADGWVVVNEERDRVAAGERVIVEHRLPAAGR
ncbi:MAG: gephyrin-like molybdotransferase Glp [Salinirussus sp.]